MSIAKSKVSSESPEMIEYVKRRKKIRSKTRFTFLKKLFLNKFFLYSLTVCLLIFFFVYVFPKIDNLPVFKITEFKIYGNESISEEEISLSLQKFEGESMLSVQTEEIEDYIKQSNLYIEEVYVRKSLPGTIEVDIVERYPSLIVIDFSGTYLLDSKFKVISILNKQEFDIANFELDILQDYANLNADFVKERYFASLSEEERADLKWEDVDQDEKIQTIEKIKEDINNRLTTFLSDQTAVIEASAFKDLPVNYFLFTKKGYEIGQYYDRDKISFTENARLEFLNLGFKINDVRWTTEFRLEIKFDDAKKAILTDQDSLQLQIEKMQLLLINGFVGNQREFDLRGIKYTSE